jgi:hypothetical protein
VHGGTVVLAACPSAEGCAALASAGMREARTLRAS